MCSVRWYLLTERYVSQHICPFSSSLFFISDFKCCSLAWLITNQKHY